MLQELELPKTALIEGDIRPSSTAVTSGDNLSGLRLFLDARSEPDGTLVDELTQAILNTVIPEEYYSRMVNLPPESQQDAQKTLSTWFISTATSYRLAKASQSEGAAEANEAHKSWSPAGAMTRLGMIWNYMYKSPLGEIGVNTPGYNTGSIESWGMNEEGIIGFREKARELRAVERAEAVLRGQDKPPSFADKEDWYYFMGSLCMLKVEDARRKFEEQKP